MIPSIDRLLRIDARETIIDIPAQSVVTREGTNLFVDGVVYFKVFDANKALLAIGDVRHSIELLAQTKLREVLALHTYQEIQMDRLTLAMRLKKILDVASDPWGVEVTRMELTDLKLPQTLQLAMNAEQEAKRRAVAELVNAKSRAEVAMLDAQGMGRAQLVNAKAAADAKLVAAKAAAEAKRIEATGEKAAAEDFKKAADIFAQAPVTLQLRYLQTLKSMGEGKSNTIVIPYNADTMSMTSGAAAAAAAGKVFGKSE